MNQIRPIPLLLDFYIVKGREFTFYYNYKTDNIYIFKLPFCQSHEEKNT